MTLVCRNCSRVNPSEARYCYWDGAVLDGRTAGGGPIAVSARPFLSPFVFPSGRQCRSFDELVLGCYGEWKVALNLLREGYLEGFFGAIGRADLALASKQAAKTPDLERGLDELLSKLPSGSREPPKLIVQPLEVNLGQIARGTDRRIVLRLENQGMGLLQGNVSCDDAAWLALGDGSGSPRKVFQCLNDFTLQVQIHGKALRAGNKPLEGRLTIESNGGTAVVVFRADVPVKPFPDGTLAGATSPRQVAEKAKANPKGAAPLFESGAVAAWYESNGWTYPVQGPAASGLGVIQQFFEALGLVKAPVVEISEIAVHLQGTPGAHLEHVLQVRAQERRPVFAHATTGVPWLRIGRILLDGRTARIPLKVSRVPDRPGERLQGKVQVTANGGQRFLVDVTLTVIAQLSANLASTENDSPFNFTSVPVITAADVDAEIETIPEVVAVQPAPFSGPASPWQALHSTSAQEHDIKQHRHAVQPAEAFSFQQGEPSIGKESRGGSRFKHVIPLAILATLLLSVVAHDLWLIAFQPSDTTLLDPDPFVAIHFHDTPDDKLPFPTMRFGLTMPRAKDPANSNQPKRLTFDERGRSNNTVLRVDGQEFIFGQPPGNWLEIRGKLQGESSDRPRDGIASSWLLPDAKLRVTQEVELVAGPQSRLLDTCLVRYILENQDTRPHRVGIRFMLDTFIGANDGVPFTIPGASGLCETKMRFDTPSEVPDFIQALEKDDPADPGTVAYLQFRIGKKVESPSRVLLCGWPNPELLTIGIRAAKAQLTGWDVPFISIRERVGNAVAKDSAVVVYWDERELQPNVPREVGFTYGLGSVDTKESGGHLMLTVGGRLVRHGEFTLTALVHDPRPGEKLTLELPPGFARIEGGEEQIVPPVPPGAARPDSPVTWRVRSGDDGKYELVVRSSQGSKQKLPLVIRTRGVFD